MEDKYDLPRGVVRACAGLVESCPNERVAQAIKRAEQVIGVNYSENAVKERQELIRAIKLNLINRKIYSYEWLRRAYGLPIGYNQFGEEKKKFCYALAKELAFTK